MNQQAIRLVTIKGQKNTITNDTQLNFGIFFLIDIYEHRQIKRNNRWELLRTILNRSLWKEIFTNGM